MLGRDTGSGAPLTRPAGLAAGSRANLPADPGQSETAPEGGAVQAPRRTSRLVLEAYLRNIPAMVGAGLVVLITLFCFLGPLLYHTNQVTVRLDLESLPPGGQHPLGTDPSGYDVLGRLMLGGQSSLELGFAVSIATTVIGSLYGAIAGLAGGITDAIMMRVIDTLLSLPTLVFLIILASLYTPNLWTLILLLTLLSWLGVARLVRAEVLTLRVREYVQAATMMGIRRGRLLLHHLLPNSIGVIVVTATFTIADAILTLSTLSFLGLGLPPPHADWGSMLNDGLNYLFDGYWWQVYPAATILILTIIAFNLIGDGIRDSLDVRTQRTQ